MQELLSRLNKRGSETIANAPTKAQRGGVNFKKLIDNCGAVNIPKTVLAASIALTATGYTTAQAMAATAEESTSIVETQSDVENYGDIYIANATGFVDVDDSKYYADAIKWAVDNKVTNGIGNNQFGVNSNVTRGQAVTFLWRAVGSPSPKGTGETFLDVEEGSWYELAVKWAVENHITDGVGANKFDPDGPVTRGQMITFLWRTKGAVGETRQGDQWYSAAERWAQSKGLLTGTAQAYTTNGECPRCDVVYYLWKEVKNIGITSGSSNSGSSNSGSNNGSTANNENTGNNGGKTGLKPGGYSLEDLGLVPSGIDAGDPNVDHEDHVDCSDLHAVC